MENPEEILHSLEEFSKMKPKDIPRELEEYLCYVAKTGNPVYQWPTIKSLFREKLINVITEFYESCPTVDIPPCPNVDIFNYELMKNFILEKLDTFSSAPFTVQRISELLTTPRKEYNRIDKYMRALEKNILVVSTTEPGRRSTENGESIMNGIESEHLPESSNSSHDINVEEMDETPTWPRVRQVTPILFESNENEGQTKSEEAEQSVIQESFENEPKITEMPSSSTVTESEVQQETVITCTGVEDLEQPYVSIEPVPLDSHATTQEEKTSDSQSEVSVTITAIPAGVQQRRSSMERVGSSECETITIEKPSEIIVPEEVTQTEEQPEIAIEDQILATVSSTETVEEPPPKEEIPVETPEKIDAPIQEETGIENISPENSTLSPDVSQADVSSETEKVQQLDEKTPETTVKEPETTENAEKAKTEQTLATETTEEVPVEKPDEENIVKESSDLTEIPALQKDLEDDNTVDSTTEKEEDKNEVFEETKTEPKMKEVPLEPDSSAIEETKNDSDQIPMEVDISETEIEKKLISDETPTSVGDPL